MSTYGEIYWYTAAWAEVCLLRKYFICCNETIRKRLWLCVLGRELMAEIHKRPSLKKGKRRPPPSPPKGYLVDTEMWNVTAELENQSVVTRFFSDVQLPKDGSNSGWRYYFKSPIINTSACWLSVWCTHRLPLRSPSFWVSNDGPFQLSKQEKRGMARK